MNTNPITFPKEKIYLLNFLKKIQSRENTDMLKLNSHFNELLKILLSKPPIDYMVKPCKANEYQIDLPAWKDKAETNWYLSKASQETIIAWLYNKFDFYFQLHMDTLAREKIQYKIAVGLFIDMFDLDEDKFDMLLKRNYRNNRKMFPKKSENIARQFNSILSDCRPLLSFFVISCPFLF